MLVQISGLSQKYQTIEVKLSNPYNNFYRISQLIDYNIKQFKKNLFNFLMKMNILLKYKNSQLQKKKQVLQSLPRQQKQRCIFISYDIEKSKAQAQFFLWHFTLLILKLNYIQVFHQFKEQIRGLTGTYCTFYPKAFNLGSQRVQYNVQFGLSQYDVLFNETTIIQIIQQFPLILLVIKILFFSFQSNEKVFQFLNIN
ncbi:unnamed protein product [Paramecium octaurelia]|uniref:Uncharacterized protein n=1 Tax=Paramecium octaurelia TaxID=43137 RepID=A0A8S1U9K9_PAROT|nr:unnamed protein product [Paramecium octaurelia]